LLKSQRGDHGMGNEKEEGKESEGKRKKEGKGKNTPKINFLAK